MVPSAIRRDPDVPLRTRTLPNGAIVVENAYEGTVYLGDVEVGRVKGLRVENPFARAGDRPEDDTRDAG